MAQKKHLLKINGMHCISCSMVIDGDLEDTKGVISAKTHYAKQVTEVVFDEGEITVEKIIEIVKKTGYEAALHDGST